MRWRWIILIACIALGLMLAAVYYIFNMVQPINIRQELLDSSYIDGIKLGSLGIITDKNATLISEKANIIVSPHTLTASTNFIDVEIVDKFSSDEYNLLFGFTNTKAKPSKIEVYNPRDEIIDRTFTCKDNGMWLVLGAEAICYRNSTAGNNEIIFKRVVDKQDIKTGIVEWKETQHIDWDTYTDIKNMRVNFNGRDNYYYVPINFTKDLKKKIRVWLDVPIGKNVYGKFDVAIAPKSYGESLSLANLNNNYIVLDPWWNLSYTYCKNITHNFLGTINRGAVEFNFSDGTNSGVVQYIFSGSNGANYSIYYNTFADFRIANKGCDDDTATDVGFGVRFNTTATARVNTPFYVFETYEWYANQGDPTYATVTEDGSKTYVNVTDKRKLIGSQSLFVQDGNTAGRPIVDYDFGTTMTADPVYVSFWLQIPSDGYGTDSPYNKFDGDTDHDLAVGYAYFTGTNMQTLKETVVLTDTFANKWYWQNFSIKTSATKAIAMMITHQNLSRASAVAPTSSTWGDAADTFRQFKFSGSNGGTGNGYYDNLILSKEVTEPYNQTVTISLGGQQMNSDTTKPSLVFLQQIPSDLNLTNFLGTAGVNITYNVSDNIAINQSTIFMYYKTNSTQDNIMYFQNGTAVSGYFHKSYLSNNSVNYTWNFLDNELLPGTYNYGEVTMENTTHNFEPIVAPSQFISIELLNVSAEKQYGFLEVMANRSSGTGVLNVLYCNTSYAYNNNPSTNANCFQFGTIITPQFNHNHTQYSGHQVISFPVNTTTHKIGTVVVTNTSNFILKGSAGSTWNIYYIANNSRANAFKNSSNNGNTWLSQTYSIDSHLHQFGTNTSLYYYACANDTTNNLNCSAVRQDMLEFGNLPPTSPEVYSPTANEYQRHITIPINYTEAISPSDYYVWYNISLANITLDVQSTIITNNTNKLNYGWNANAIAVGEYVVKVEACDNNGFCSSGFSSRFNITLNPPPVWSSLKNKTTYQNKSVSFSIAATDEVGISCYTLNDTSNFTINCAGLIKNNTLLYEVRTYNLNVSANDTANNVIYGVIWIDVKAAIPSTGVCRYRDYGYWNNALPFMKESGCT